MINNTVKDEEMTFQLDNSKIIDNAISFNFFTDLLLQDNVEGNDIINFPDTENFAFLTCLLMMWINYNQENILFQIKSPICLKIIVKKFIGKTELIKLAKLFEKLTLQTINFIDNTNEWFAYVNF